MTDKLKLKTTGDQLSQIWARVGELRADAQVVKIEPEIMKNILFDYQAMYQLVKDQVGGEK